MAKRFTDTDKWKKPFIKSLPSEYKLFWLFIIDECDHAGVWHVELEVAEARLGIKLSLEKIRGFFKERIVEFDNGTKMFIPDFVQFQYGSLNETNRAHSSVLNVLKKYDLLKWVKPLTRPLQGAMDKDKDKDKELDKEKGGVGENILFTIEHCLTVAMNDDRFVRSNKTNDQELLKFNQYLERQGIYEHNPLDYKRYFAKLKGKWPDVVKPDAVTLSIDQLRAIARQMDQQNLKTA